jgi:hypothetical protein
VRLASCPHGCISAAGLRKASSSSGSATARTRAQVWDEFGNSVLAFHAGVRHDLPALRVAASKSLLPLKAALGKDLYLVLELHDLADRATMPQPLVQQLEVFSVVSQSGRPDQHQGADAVMEEMNRQIKPLHDSAAAWDSAAAKQPVATQTAYTLQHELALPQQSHSRRGPVDQTADVLALRLAWRLRQAEEAAQQGVADMAGVPVPFALDALVAFGRAKVQEVYSRRWLVSTADSPWIVLPAQRLLCAVVAATH